MADFKDARSIWDRRYAGADGFLFGEAPNLWLQRHAVRLAPGSHVLCVADGEGRNGVFLAGLGHDVRTFDLSPIGVERANAMAAKRVISLRTGVAHVDDWLWESDAYDAVVAVFIQVASPPVRTRMFEGIRKAIKPGGLLIIEGYGPRQLVYRTGGPGIAENLYTLPMILNAFSSWDVIASRDCDLELHEGAGHDGISHSIAAVLRRPVLD